MPGFSQTLGEGTVLVGDIASKMPQGADGHRAANVTTAQVLALFTTPVLVIPAPGAGKIIIPSLAYVHKPAGTAYGGIAAGEELSIGYVGGAEYFQIASAGFLDQATAQQRIALAHAIATGPASITPTVNAGIEIKLLIGNITTGTSALLVKVFYKIIDQVPSLF